VILVRLIGEEQPVLAEIGVGRLEGAHFSNGFSPMAYRLNGFRILREYHRPDNNKLRNLKSIYTTLKWLDFKKRK